MPWLESPAITEARHTHDQQRPTHGNPDEMHRLPEQRQASGNGRFEHAIGFAAGPDDEANVTEKTGEVEQQILAEREYRDRCDRSRGQPSIGNGSPEWTRALPVDFTRQS